MAVTVTDVRTLAPELSTVSDATIGLWLGWAAGAVSASQYGSDADQAVLLWTAHQCLRASPGLSGSTGSVTDRRVGDVSIATSAGSPTSDTAGLRSSAYGLALLALARRRCGGPVVV